MSILTLLNPFGWGALFGGGYVAKLDRDGPRGSSSGGYGNSAGKSVTPEAAMRLSAYWACVKIIAQTIGTMPLELHRTAPDGSRVLAKDDPLFDILRYQPHIDFDAVEFWEGVGACLAVWGNSYSYRQKIGDRLVGLEPLRNPLMTVFRGEDGSPVYRYADPYGGRIDYRADDILHIRGFGFCDYLGLSPIAFNSQFLGSAIAADEVSGSLFRNGMRMSGWFRYKGGNGILTQQQQADTRAALITPYVGSENAGKVGLLPGDFDWIATNMNPADAQLIDNRRMNVEEICRAFGVPPILVGHIASGQTMWGSGVEHIVLAFMTTGLRPYLARIQASIGRQLIGRAGRQTLEASFDFEELLRGDNKSMAEVACQLANNGIKTRKEIRTKNYNLPPKPGSDTLTVQSALLPIELLGEVAKLPRDKAVTAGADVAPPPPASK